MPCLQLSNPQIVAAIMIIYSTVCTVQYFIQLDHQLQHSLDGQDSQTHANGLLYVTLSMDINYINALSKNCMYLLYQATTVVDVRR